MARAAGKKQAPAKIEEEDDTDGWEEAVVDADGKDAKADLRLRDWRDVERYREMKELRRLVDDDYGLEEIFHVPLKPRGEPGVGARAAAKAPASPKPAPAAARGRGNGATPAAKTAAKPAARPDARPTAAAAGKKAAPARKVTAKAKHR